MSLVVRFSQKRFANGISDYLKEDALDTQQRSVSSFVMAKAVNYRDDPQSVTLLPGALKESGSVVTDLIKWGDTIPTLTKYFFYGNAGNIYQRTSAGAWSNLHTVVSSHGNGLAYFTGDDYLYYTSDSTLGRYGPVSGSSPQFSDNFLQAQGGVPLNTNSLALLSASSQYATAADSASLSVTGDLTLEAYFKATTLPTVGNSMTLMGKWDESTNHRSYKADIFAISGYFGDGSDGALTISADTTESPIDASCTGTATTQTLSATNVSFAQGQVILIHQSQGTNAGQWERNTIQGYTAGTITLGTPLLGTYVSGAQVRVMKQYSAITINSGKNWTAKAWGGTVGGILANLCSGTITVTGTISAAGTGFRGGNGLSGTGTASTGEGTAGVSISQTSANGNGGGGSNDQTSGDGKYAGGGGGSNGSQGESGFLNGGGGAFTGDPGNIAGSTDLTTAVFGGGGGGIAIGGGGAAGAAGGNGGGFIFLTGTTITVSGAIVAPGNGGSNATDSGVVVGNGGSGAGGSILLKAQVATLGTGLITASGGARGVAVGGTAYGGAGGDGRIHLDYLTSYTGTTTPTLDVNQDSTLVTTTTYQARLGISSNGTALEYLTMNLTNLSTGTWNRLSITWKASTSTATFYLNALPLGTFTGTKTSISDNVALFYLGANKTSAVANFFNGLVDDVRVWSNVQTASQIMINNQMQLQGTEAGLQAYYKLNGSAADSTGNANDLTLVNSPSYSTDVPFPDASTRLDIDASGGGTANTYSLLTAISESSSNLLSFTPVNDPQKSIAFTVNAAGTGTWTVTIHDQQNNVIATQSIAPANVPASGNIEFTFTTPWRIVIGKTYHAHLTVSAGTSSVKTTTSSNFSTAAFVTYFSFLVTDVAFHPIVPFLNFVAIGNERYIAKWDGAFYEPNFITFPPGWRVRCFGLWREFLAIAVWKGTNIYDYPKGRIYFWDGISPTFNFFIDVGEGQVNALYGIDSDLFIVAGYRIYLYDYAGGYFYNTGNTKSNMLKRLPNNQIPESDAQEVFPGAITMWRSLVHIGLNAVSNSTTVERGVYSYGTFNKDYPDTLSYDYPISTGNTGSTVAIGCVYPVGKQLVIGWQDGIAFGADIIDFTNPPASQGYIQMLVQDDGVIWKDKSNIAIRPDFLALQSGESFSAGYKIDRAASWTTSPVNSTVGSDNLEFNIDTTPGVGREYQLRVDLFATGATSPTLLGMSLLGNTLSEEKNF